MKLTFFSLLLTFAVFLNSIELGRSQQSDPELSSSDDETPNRNRGRNAHRLPRIPEGIPISRAPVHSQGFSIQPFPHQGPGPRFPLHEPRPEAPNFVYGSGSRNSQRRHQPPVRSQSTQIPSGYLHLHEQAAYPPPPHSAAAVHPYPNPPRGPPPPQQ